ncbi:LacI family transcriptional regulator [Devosia pacifica]|uniref:LacI family transcriptional regulator n=1 Tax=Devosia pacifica TaxID=1335967 RepID=A0A918VQA2_9HYPH|nr:LacI family DNA-binding transcriptional regulator [Devosia pacifica]GHA16275.1 LacI family transcriptional regulator [Devosia pacifica]
MSKRVRMLDIARTAGVSQTTVSLVLNRVPNVRIAEDTRQRVFDAARELGYAPGPSLAEPTTSSLRRFGVLINEISAAYPIDLIEGLQTLADDQGVQLIIQVTGGLADREAAALETLRVLGVEGIIYASTFTAIVEPTTALSALPHVLLNCRRADGVGTAIVPAERAGGFLATRHLIERGCKRIATITGDPWQEATRARLHGYRHALRRAGLSVPEHFVRTGDWSHHSGDDSASQLFALSDSPDGIFCHNDKIARGAIAAARRLGVAIPEDVAIVGYDDREFAADLEPSLTSVTLPHAEMAERAMTVLLKGKAGLDRPLRRVHGRLIERASSSRQGAR